MFDGHYVLIRQKREIKTRRIIKLDLVKTENTRTETNLVLIYRDSEKIYNQTRLNGGHVN